MTVVPQGEGALARSNGGGSGNLYDVLDLILDRGLVIDVFARVSLVGIELVKVDARIVVASVDTYLRFAEACNRLDLEAGKKAPAQLTDIVGEVTEGGAHGKTKGALSGAAEAIGDAIKGRKGDEDEEDEAEEEDEEEKEPVASRRERPARRSARRRRE
ncbi:MULTISPECIES: gas vesicle structural protein GvpA [unclassified Streptomyces]|uniref:gas vesicle structural protein GvpA n=1 Tax=unclassified Streptomyces TaxID=2593676 RepID=UPI000C27F581|nr:gas vesicle structural protein GvpA [Streptomyces sp. CB02959]PJN34488.1 gas vesicle protein [Streptomyces sp. CB02959]